VRATKACTLSKASKANKHRTVINFTAERKRRQAFEHILIDAVAKFDVELFSYCVLSNHWHLVVRPQVDGEISRFA